MRTTLTVDDALLARLKQRARERGVSLREIVNDTLRAGLDGSAPRRQHYRVPALKLRARPGVDLDRALALAGELEDREIVRKLARGK